MRNYLDYKYTTWGRIYFKENSDIKKVIEKLEQGYLPSEICDEQEFDEFVKIDDVEEFITPIENDGQSTIEVYVNDNIIWDNSFESEIKRKNESNRNK